MKHILCRVSNETAPPTYLLVVLMSSGIVAADAAEAEEADGAAVAEAAVVAEADGAAA